jgi:spore coat polysaccharide biosynthesis protein SpsF
VSHWRTGCVAAIQARMGSTRLPGKVLADLGGKPLVQRVYERTRAAALVDEVVVLTSTAPSDDVLVERLTALGIPTRRGPEQDVLARYLALADELQPRFVVRVTGDCPFVDPGFIDLQLGALRAFDADLVHVANNAGGAIEGTLGGQSAFSVRALRFAASSSDPRDREHVGAFFFTRHAAAFRTVEIEVDPVFEWPGLRLQVDEAADLDFARALWAAADERGDGRFALARALQWLDAHPEVRATNAHVLESADNRALRALARERDPHPRDPAA